MLNTSDKTSEFAAQAMEPDRPLAAFWMKPDAGYEWFEWEYHDHLERQPNDPGPWLVPKGDDWARYPILRRRRLLPELVGLGRHCTPERILAFANEWGSLGRDERMVPRNMSSAASIRTWHQESAKLSVLWQLWEWARTGDAEKVAPYVRWFQRPTSVQIAMIARSGVPDEELTTKIYPTSGERTISIKEAAPGELLWGPIQLLAGESYDQWGLLRKWKFGDSLGPIRYYVASEINKELLSHVSRTVLPFLDYAIRYFPDSLLTAAYIQLQDHIAQGAAAERECLAPFCPNGSRFIPRRRDQKFCNPQCRNRAHYHSNKTGALGGKKS